VQQSDLLKNGITKKKKITSKMPTTPEIVIRNKAGIVKHLPELKEKLAKIGTVLKSKLGRKTPGSYGIAFATDKGNVMKITSDKQEALVSAKIKTMKFKHVVKIFRVFTFNSVKGAYFIEQERLFPLSSSEIGVMDRLGPCGSDSILYYEELAAKYNMLRSLEAVYDAERRFSYDEEKDLLFDDLYSEIHDPAVLGYLIDILFDYDAEEIKKWGSFPTGSADITLVEKAFKGLKELNDKGVAFTDVHGGNLMQTKSKVYKLIDLGQGSRAIGKGRIEVVEGLFPALAAKMETLFLHTLGNTVHKKLKEIDEKYKFINWPEKKKFKITLPALKEGDPKFVYLITLVGNSFILVNKIPNEEVICKVPNNLDERRLTSKILNFILDHYKDEEEDLGIVYTVED